MTTLSTPPSSCPTSSPRRPDLLRAMLCTFMQALMGADADAACNTDYGQRTPERTNACLGYRPRQLDTWAGTIELAVPK